MIKYLSIAVVLLLAACATPYDPREIEAVRDFVIAAELEQVDRVRIYGQLHYTYVNDRYIMIPTRRGDYLAELRHNCRELRSNEFTPDMVDRRESDHYIRARFDTIRGCTIDTIYAITEAQREEIRDLGDAPGENVFIPEQDETAQEKKGKP